MGDAPLPVWGRVLYHLLCSEIDAAADWFETMLRWRKLAEIMNLHVEP
jgi:hypothetical protein